MLVVRSLSARRAYYARFPGGRESAFAALRGLFACYACVVDGASTAYLALVD